MPYAKALRVFEVHNVEDNVVWFSDRLGEARIGKLSEPDNVIEVTGNCMGSRLRFLDGDEIKMVKRLRDQHQS